MKRFLVLFLAIGCTAGAESPKSKSAPASPRSKQSAPVVQLDLIKAETIALQQSPTVFAAQYKALAAQQVVREVRSAFYPQITAEFSAVATGDDIADHLGWNKFTHQDTRIAASGGLNNPTVLSRQANGILFSQLLTDFGRTWNLTAASKSLALSEAQKSALARAKRR